MASKSDRDSQNDRAALPFEPRPSKAKGKGEKGSRAGEESGAAQAKKDKSKKAKKAAKDSGSAVSAKAQAQVNEIRAENRKRAEKAKKARSKSDGALNSGPDSDGSIPKEVSRRMVRRMAILSITPVALGVSIFFVAYYLLSHDIVTFAPVVVLLTTMGCFGLGVVGLTYGMLSASWDDEPGSLIGFEQFKLNFGRLMDARRAAKESKT